MKNTIKHIILYGLQIFLVVFWLDKIYIALGVAGLYAEQPYTSVFSGLSGDWYLLVTLLLLGLSILGWYLTGPTAPMATYTRYKRQVILFIQFPTRIVVPMYRIILVRIKVFKMRFAPFPGKAGIRINYDTWRYLRQTCVKEYPEVVIKTATPRKSIGMVDNKEIRVFWRTFFAIIKTATRDENIKFHQKVCDGYSSRSRNHRLLSI